MKTENVIHTGIRYAELSDSAKAMVSTLAARYCAACIPPRDNGQHFGESQMIALHNVMSRDAMASAFEHTGGGIFLSYSVHCDVPSGQEVFVCAGDESCAFFIPDASADSSDAQECANAVWELCGDDSHLKIAAIYPYDNRNGIPSDAVKVFAAVGNLEMAAAMLDAESVRLYGTPLDNEQRDALRDGSQSFAMLDDAEARMGFRVAEPRALVAAAHALLAEVSPAAAQRVHLIALSHEYGRTMADFGLRTFASADEFAAEGKAHELATDYAREFCERWDNDATGIAAPYACTCTCCGKSVAACNEDGNCSACESEEAEELRDELSELESAIDALAESSRDAFATLSGRISDIRAELRTLRTRRDCDHTFDDGKCQHCGARLTAAERAAFDAASGDA